MTSSGLTDDDDLTRETCLKRIAYAVAAVLASTTPLAIAQNYPDRPIRVLVPVPGGGTPDVLARVQDE